MEKTIKKLVHSSDPKIDFDWITLTKNQNKFLDVFNNFMDQVGNPIFDHFMQRSVASHAIFCQSSSPLFFFNLRKTKLRNNQESTLI